MSNVPGGSTVHSKMKEAVEKLPNDNQEDHDSAKSNDKHSSKKMSSVPSIFSRPLHLLFFFYFLSHIPITIFIDAQPILLPYLPNLYPPMIQQVLKDFWLDPYQDKLMAIVPVWFASFGVCEVFVQLPFFFMALYAFIAGKNWIRIPAIIYASHVMTTLVPIMAAFLFDKEYLNHNPTLLATYAVYFVIPLLLLLNMVAYEKPFDYSTHKEKSH